jgi:two-component system alkaline phosphatase synthesis response regulator PhoP
MPFKILVVDDEPHLVRLMEFILAKQGHTMVSAVNGREALVKAKSERPDLILLDIMIPYIDGYEVARTLRDDDELKSTPIILLSAKAQEEDIQRGLELGVDEYITKPFAPDHLVKVVNSYLGSTENAN